MNNLPDNIFDFIQQKSFEELSEKEQQDVLPWISEEEYNDLHQVCLFEQEQTTQPMLSISSHREELWQAIQPNKPRVSFWTSKKPWQYAAAALIPICFFLGWKMKTPQAQQLVVQTIHDTLRIQIPGSTRIIQDTITQVKERIVYVYRNITNQESKLPSTIKPSERNYVPVGHMDLAWNDTAELRSPQIKRIFQPPARVSSLDSFSQEIGFYSAEMENIGELRIN
jgi:hypothetical protein